MYSFIPSTKSIRAHLWEIEKKEFCPLPTPLGGGKGFKPIPSISLRRLEDEVEGRDQDINSK